jgi:hypothetical protein
MQVTKKFVKLSTASDGVNGAVLPANFASPANYTPTDSFIKGHLEGIDNKFGTIGGTTGDIAHTSFSLANNQASAANVTGLAFANGTTRAADVFYSVFVDATSDLFESGHLQVIQRGSDWTLTQSSNGDNSLVNFTINASGQIQYTTPSYSGFVSATMKFRAITTQV